MKMMMMIDQKPDGVSALYTDCRFQILHSLSHIYFVSRKGSFTPKTLPPPVASPLVLNVTVHSIVLSEGVLGQRWQEEPLTLASHSPIVRASIDHAAGKSNIHNHRMKKFEWKFSSGKFWVENFEWQNSSNKNRVENFKWKISSGKIQVENFQVETHGISLKTNRLLGEHNSTIHFKATPR